MQLPVDSVKSDPDAFIFVKATLSKLLELGWGTPREIEIARWGVHRDSYERGFYKVIIKATYNA